VWQPNPFSQCKRQYPRKVFTIRKRNIAWRRNVTGCWISEIALFVQDWHFVHKTSLIKRITVGRAVKSKLESDPQYSLISPARCEVSLPSVGILSYSLTPWCRVFLEKLTGLQLVKKFPVFHGTRTFITALTSVRQLSLSWASPAQSIYPHPTS